MPPEDDEEESPVDDRPTGADPPPDEPVLAPEDLEFTHHEEVAELEEGKFVIGTEGPPNTSAVAEQSSDSTADRTDQTESSEEESPTESGQEGTDSQTEGGSAPNSGLSGREVKRWLTAELERTDSDYAYRIAAKTEETVSHQQLASDDISMAFDALLMWYAQQVGGDTAVEEVLGILLAKSNIRVRFPTRLLTAYLSENDLEPGDDIGDLIQTVRENDGLVFPREP
ncbi:MAG: hypothetical protein ABEJ58_00445 [Halodesulfurarchaeum sp.]